jgi:hypothetical protein
MFASFHQRDEYFTHGRDLFDETMHFGYPGQIHDEPVGAEVLLHANRGPVKVVFQVLLFSELILTVTHAKRSAMFDQEGVRPVSGFDLFF